MIGIIFTLAAALLLLLQVLTMDALLLWRRLGDEFESDLGHDTLVFPDHDPKTPTP